MHNQSLPDRPIGSGFFETSSGRLLRGGPFGGRRRGHTCKLRLPARPPARVSATLGIKQNQIRRIFRSRMN